MLKKLQNISVYWFLLLVYILFYVSELLVSIYADPESLNLVISWFALPLEGWKETFADFSWLWQLWRYLSYVFISRTLLSFIMESVCLYLIIDGLRRFCRDSEIVSVYIYSAVLSGVLCRLAGLCGGEGWLYGSSAGLLGLLGYLCLLIKEETMHIWLIVMIPVRAKVLWAVILIGCLISIFYGVFFVGLSNLFGFFCGSFLAYRFSDKMDVRKLYSGFKSFVYRRYLKYRRRHLHSLRPASAAASAPEPEAVRKQESGANIYLDSIMKKLAEEGSKSLSEEERAYLDSVTLKRKERRQKM
ncbi:rhomboid family intramembrane serine protease [bacterium]|nr:rhomboid family intramembrane serine protease [bacterium]